MPRKYNPWSRQEYDTLEALINEGLSYSAIAERMERELLSVQGTAQRLGMTNSARQGWRKRQDWPAIDRLIEECIETRLMTIPQAAVYIRSVGHTVCQASIYDRVNQSRALKARARQNKRLRMTAVCRRIHRRRQAA